MTNRTGFAAIAALTFVFAAGLAVADTSPAPVAPPQAKAEKKATDARVDDQAIVCKREDSTGTRLGATRVCHTRAQWATIAEDSRQNAQHLQNGVIYH